MGFSSTYRLRGSGLRGTLIVDTGATGILPEPRGQSVRRLVVSILLPNQIGLLRRALVTIAKGIQADDGSERSLPFSIDGSFSSSICDVFVMAFVVRPEGWSLDALPTPQVRQRLRSALISAMHDVTAEPASALQDKCRVEDFLTEEQPLFDEMSFAEYRFRATAGGAAGLTGLLSKFSAWLGEREPAVPIAYMYYPYSDDESASSAQPIGEALSAKVGIATPKSMVDAVEIDLKADALSREFGCRFSKYDPSLPSEHFDDRFTVIGDYREGAESLKNEPDQASLGPIDLVFSVGEARPGYVGAMMSGEAGSQALGASMTVLGGSTLAYWAVPARLGGLLSKEISSIPERNPDRTPLVIQGYAQLAAKGRTPSASFWIAWWFDDHSGVFRDLVEHIIGAVQESCGQDATVDFRYTVSRVLADGNSCAGKLLFDILGPVPSRDVVLERLRAIESPMIAQHGLVTRGPSDRSRKVVVVSDREPGSEPWASLLVGTGRVTGEFRRRSRPSPLRSLLAISRFHRSTSAST